MITVSPHRQTLWPDSATWRYVSDENQTRLAPTLDPNIMAHIGRKLRAMYDHIVAEGVPEPFAEILRRLDEPRHEDSKNDPTPPII